MIFTPCIRILKPGHLNISNFLITVVKTRSTSEYQGTYPHRSSGPGTRILTLISTPKSHYNLLNPNHFHNFPTLLYIIRISKSKPQKKNFEFFLQKNINGASGYFSSKVNRRRFDGYQIVKLVSHIL